MSVFSPSNDISLRSNTLYTVKIRNRFHCSLAMCGPIHASCLAQCLPGRKKFSTLSLIHFCTSSETKTLWKHIKRNVFEWNSKGMLRTWHMKLIIGIDRRLKSLFLRAKFPETLSIGTLHVPDIVHIAIVQWTIKIECCTPCNFTQLFPTFMLI